MGQKNGKVLVTGAAGFIGYFLTLRLLGEGYRVVGLDNINDYYDVGLKYGRLAELGIARDRVDPGPGAGSAGESGAKAGPENGAGGERGGSGLRLIESETRPEFRFVRLDLADREGMEELFDVEKFDMVVNLAAQAGVRYSLENPHAYIRSNVEGFLNILEGCRRHPVDHLVYASSSSVYGSNTEKPFRTRHNVDHPVSLYAATKKSNELMAHTYSHLFGIPSTGLRFFTVYGPWGRPDMAYFKFAERITAGKPIDVYNFGRMSRDFTYIDDIVESMVRLLPLAPRKGEGNTGQEGDAPCMLFNIGHNKPVDLLAFIGRIEKELGIEAEKNLMEIQPGDVPSTWADVSDLFERIDYIPQVGIEEGIAEFVRWYRQYKKMPQT